MAIKKINVASFADVFFFAEEKFKIDWNDCCDLFHRTEYFRYKGQTEFYIEEVEGNFKDPDPLYDSTRKQNEVMLAFMKENNVKVITILGD